MASRVRIDGLRGAVRAVRRLPAAMQAARAETLHEWADAVEAGAEERVPRRTGYLASTIEQLVDEGRGTAAVGVFDQRALEYAEHVEHGTSSMRDQPYLRPAFDEERPKVPRVYRAAFRRHLGGGE